MTDASVIIPALNNRSTLPAQLDALAAQRFDRDWEIIVVDNGSADGTAELVVERGQTLQHLRLVRELDRGRSTGGAARNAGARAARSDRLLFCDADDVVSAAWVDALWSALDDFDLVGGALEYELLNDERQRASRELIQTDALSTPMSHLPYSSTASFAARREVFEALGGFDTSLSEVDFCWRAQYAGFSLGFAPDALVHYRLRGTARELMAQTRRYALGSEDLYAAHRRLGQLDVPPSARYKIAAYRCS